MTLSVVSIVKVFTRSHYKYSSQLIFKTPKWFRLDLVMPKTRSVGFLNAKKMPLRNHEMVYVFGKKSVNYYPKMSLGKPYKTRMVNEIELYNTKESVCNENIGTRYPNSILPVSGVVKGIHPCQKDTLVLEYLVECYSRVGEVVLDFTMGNGSVGVACGKLEEYGVDITPHDPVIGI